MAGATEATPRVAATAVARLIAPINVRRVGRGFEWGTTTECIAWRRDASQRLVYVKSDAGDSNSSDGTGRSSIDFMIKFSSLGVVLATLTVCGISAADDPKMGSWQPLLRPDLSNAEFPAGVWTTSEGVLTASEDQMLWSRRDYETFDLKLEFKTADGTNSGVIIYVSDPPIGSPIPLKCRLRMISPNSGRRRSPRGSAEPCSGIRLPLNPWSRNRAIGTACW